MKIRGRCTITPAEARRACRKQTRCYRKQAKYLYYRPPYMHRAHFTPCLHGVYTVHTLPVRVLREAVRMPSAFPRPTISAANGCAIIATFPLKRHDRHMRPVDADLIYTYTGQVALTILLENGGPMLIVGLTRPLLQWLCRDHVVESAVGLCTKASYNERGLRAMTSQACWPASRRISDDGHISAQCTAACYKNNLTGTVRCNNIHTMHVTHQTANFDSS